MSMHHSEHQQHLEDFETLLREEPARAANTVTTTIDFARNIYDPHAETARFSALVEGLRPIAEKHNRLYMEHEVERLINERNA